MASGIVRFLQAIIVLTLPVVLVMSGVRLVMSEAFLKLEYNRPGFPEDIWGFSTEDREKYGAYGVRYLIENRDISYLGDLEIEGKPAFNRRELDHMEDVQAVTRVAFQVWMLSGALCAAATIMLARQPSTRRPLRRALQFGGVSVVIVTLFLALVVLVAWNFFFDTFHGLFFDEGTWQFQRSDTLIRLYPQTLWFDASLTVGFIVLGGAFLCIFLPVWVERRQRKTAAREIVSE